MRAVIIGAGLVGRSLAAMMREEGHNIVVIDHQQEALEAIGEQLDVQTLCGHGAAESVLSEAHASDAGLVIAVTDSDEVNMISAMTAKRLGVATTVARIRNNVYLQGVRALYRNVLGIDFAVSPEALTALKLVDIVRTPGAGWVESFAEGRVRLMRFSLDEPNPRLGVPLKSFDIPRDCLLVGVSRQGRLLIPSGDDMLEAGDDVYVVADADSKDAVRKAFDVRVEPTKSVMIAWGGRVGELVAELLEGEVMVRIIEPDHERCEQLADKLHRAEVIHGNPDDLGLIEREHVGQFDVFMALGPRDDANIIACLLARDRGARNTVAVVSNPDYSGLVERLGLNTAIAPRVLVANTIIRFLRRQEVVSVAKIEDGKGQAIEFMVLEGSRVAGKPLRQIKFPKGAVVGALMRGASFLIPRGDDVLEVGDHALVYCLPEVSAQVEKLFAPR